MARWIHRRRRREQQGFLKACPRRTRFQGIPATGRNIHDVSHQFYRVENGQFAEESICSDTASLFRQLS